MPPKLEPCPFCGGGDTTIKENYMSPRMDGTATLLSADLRHWCAEGDDPYNRLYLHIRAHDEAAAIETWNRRASLASLGQFRESSYDVATD